MLKQTAQQYRKLMPSKQSLVRQMHEGRARLESQITFGFDKNRLIIAAVLRHGYAHGRGLRSASSATRALLIVLDAGRHVAANNCFEFPDVYAEFHRRRTTQEANLCILE